MPRQQVERAGRAVAPELAVRLVHDDQPVARGLAERRHRLGRQRRAGRVVGRGQQHDARPPLLTRARAWSRSRVKSSSRRPSTHSVTVSRAYSGYMEYVGANDSASRPGPAEGLQQLEHHLVGAVGRPDLLRRDRSGRVAREVRRQRAAQLGELAVGVAVQAWWPRPRPPAAMSATQAVARAVGVLVDVELHGHVRAGARRRARGRAAPRGAVGRSSRQPSKRTRTAAPWPGRSSASASATTWSATSASASRE